MNDGSIGSTFHERIMKVEGETAYCVDINTDFQSGYKVRSDASSRYTGKGQDIGQFWVKLNVGNAKLRKVSSNTSVTNGSDVYSFAGAVYGIYSDKNCQNVITTLTTDSNGNTEAVEVEAGTEYIKEQQAPAGFKLDKNVYPLTVEAGKTDFESKRHAKGNRNLD